MRFYIWVAEVSDKPNPLNQAEQLATVQFSLGCENAAQFQLELWDDEFRTLVKMLAIGARQTGDEITIGGPALDKLDLDETEAKPTGRDRDDELVQANDP